MRKLFSIIASAAMILCMGISTVNIHAEESTEETSVFIYIPSEYGKVIVNGTELVEGENVIMSTGRFDMYTLPNEYHHFDHWILNGKEEKGVFGTKGGLRLTAGTYTVEAYFEECHHDRTKRDEIYPTCTEDGYSGDVYCDETGEIMEKGHVVPAAHAYENGVCTVCGAIEEGYQEYTLMSDNTKTELNKCLGFVQDIPEKLTLQVGEFYDVSFAMNWANTPSGRYVDKNATIEGGLDDEYWACALGPDMFTIHPIKPTTETFRFVRFGIEKTIVVTVVTAESETTEIEISDTVSEEDAAEIVENIDKTEVVNVIDAISDEDMNTILTDNGITTTPEEIRVVTSATITDVVLAEGQKSVTFEITPVLVVTVNGEETEIALDNSYITGDIQITLPLNGLDLKEIIHESADGTKEYIHSDRFVINDDDTVTFSVNHFSSFTLLEEITESANNNPVIPDTGDHTSILLYGSLGLMAVVSVAVLILFRIKHA